MYLDVPTLDVLNSCNSIHSKFNANKTLLVTQAITDGEATFAPIDMAALVQEQRQNPFCKQTRKRIYEGRTIPFKISENVLLQCFVQSNPAVVFRNPHNSGSSTWHIILKLLDVQKGEICFITSVEVSTG